MQINEVKYTRRVNLGNYEHEELSVSVVPNEGDEKIVGISKHLKEKVLAALNGGSEQGNENPPVSIAAKSAIASKELETPGKGAAVATGATATVLAMVGSPASQSVPAPASETPPKRGRGRPVVNPTAQDATATSAPPASTSPSKKVIKYNRTVDFQKDALAAELEKIIPGWMTDEAKITKAKAASEAMAGKDFMDSAEGVIFPAFMAEFLKVAGFEQPKKSPL